MDALECPYCHVEFVGTVDADEDYEDQDVELVTCPMCMRSFDPYAPPTKQERPQRFDELVDTEDDDAAVD